MDKTNSFTVETLDEGFVVTVQASPREQHRMRDPMDGAEWPKRIAFTSVTSLTTWVETHVTTEPANEAPRQPTV